MSQALLPGEWISGQSVRLPCWSRALDQSRRLYHVGVYSYSLNARANAEAGGATKMKNGDLAAGHRVLRKFTSKLRHKS